MLMLVGIHVPDNMEVDEESNTVAVDNVMLTKNEEDDDFYDFDVYGLFEDDAKIRVEEVG